MPATPDKHNSVDSQLPYEEAVAQLEQVVREMESDTMSLEDLMKNYELGTQLHKIAEKRLDEAQGRIEMIRKKQGGAIDVEPFENSDKKGETTAPESAATDGPISSQDGELF